jgi:cytochrome c oxidase subunit 1
MNERLGKLHFWIQFVGFNLTFAPMHWLGLQGMVRRTWKYAPETNLGPWNLASTIGAFTIALAVLIFMINWTYSKRKGKPSGLDPWDARTIEWTIPNPTPEYNFGVSPVVHSLDDFWHQKYTEDEEGRAVRREDADAVVARHQEVGTNPPEPIHLPNPSYFPFIMAMGLPLIAYGVIWHTALWGKLFIGLGVLIIIGSLLGWGMEPLEEIHDEHHDDHGELAGAH